MIREVTHNNMPEALQELLFLIRELREEVDYLKSKEPPVVEDMNIEEAAAYLKKAKSTLYRYVNEKSIPFYKLGRDLWFSKEALDEWKKDTKAYMISQFEDREAKMLKMNGR